MNKFLILIFALMLSSCAVNMAYKGYTTPDLSVIAKGTNKEEIEAQLGGPIKIENQGDYKIYRYVYYSKDVQPDIYRAISHVGFDIVSLGLWEIYASPIELINRGKNNFIDIIYDKYNNATKIRYFPIED